MKFEVIKIKDLKRGDKFILSYSTKPIESVMEWFKSRNELIIELCPHEIEVGKMDYIDFEENDSDAMTLFFDTLGSNTGMDEEGFVDTNLNCKVIRFEDDTSIKPNFKLALGLLGGLILTTLVLNLINLDK